MCHSRFGCLIASAAFLAFFTPSTAGAQGAITRRNPSTLASTNGRYTHVVEVPAGHRLIYVAGQVALDKNGALVGAGDFKAQATQVFENLRLALAEAGATFEDVVKLNYYVVDAAQAPVLREVRSQFFKTAPPPASTLVEVRRLVRDDLLLEIEAVAAAPEKRTQ
jgi:enamine deaminase RidA (YjgF/YER057c/UK114 family)